MRKILLVEDERMLRDVYEVVLSTEPYLVQVATNGKEALEKCAYTTFDLILLDLMMPVMDGLGFLSNFSFAENPTTRIILLSNLSAGAELTAALDKGAHRSILKSDLSPRQLLATVRYELEV